MSRFIFADRLAEIPRLAAAARYHPREFAELCGLTPRTLRRQCHQSFGISPHELLNDLWQMEVQRSLKNDEMAKQIKDKWGRTWMSNFSRRFKNVSGLTIEGWQISQRQNESKGRPAKVVHSYSHSDVRK